VATRFHRLVEEESHAAPRGVEEAEARPGPLPYFELDLGQSMSGMEGIGVVLAQQIPESSTGRL